MTAPFRWPGLRRAGVLVILGLVTLAVCLLALDRMGCFSALRAPDRSSVPTGAGSDEEPSPHGWPHLRGPAFDAISKETGLADQWPETGPPILWARELGQGYSGFVVMGNRAWTQVQSRTGQYVVCLDAATGADLWQHRYDWPWQATGLYPGPYATPTWHADRIYFASPAGLVGCLEAATGRPIWSVNVQQKFNGQGTEFGYAATPLVLDGKVIVPVGGEGASVVALHADDGSTVWQAGDDPASYCPVLPITWRGRRCVVAFLRNALAIHDLRSGQRLWRHELSVSYDEHSAWPLYAEPHLMIASPFHVGAQLFRLEPQGEQIAGRSVWSNRHFSQDVLSGVLVEGHVYGFDLKDVQARAHRPSRGEFRCLELLTGQERWSTSATGHASVLAADGKLYLLNDSGTLILARLSLERWEELGRVSILGGGLCWTPPTLAQGRLFARNQSRAVCVFVGQPETLTPEEQQRAISAANLDQTPGLPWLRILTREPEYPFDAPTAAELWLWFGVCLGGVFLPMTLIVGLSAGLRRWLGFRVRLTGHLMLWGTGAFGLGLAGTTFYGTLCDSFVFTWPASLFMAFLATLGSIAWAEAQANRRRARWVSRLTTLSFLAGCLGYFELCKAVGVVMGWSFLAGFLPAFPLAWLAVRSLRPPASLVRAGIWSMLAFAVYFWVSGLLPTWKVWLVG